MSITAKEIAQICGVSRGTVDRALNNRLGINPETRNKILETAQRLGYQPDFLAKSLVTGKTKTIGVVVFDVYSRFFGQLVQAIEFRTKELGYFVYLTLTDKDPGVEKQCIEHLNSRKVDGIILFPINKGIPFEKSLRSMTIPVVTIVNKVGKNLDNIGINDKAAIFDSVKFLKEKGHNRIIYVTTLMEAKEHSNMYAVEQRLEGFISACTQLGIPESKNNVIAVKGYTEAVFEKLQLKNPPTAILCSNDFYALEVMRYLKLKKYKIPEDVSIMGFDNIDALRYIEPGLTTIDYPIEELGVRAVDLLVARLENQKTKAHQEVVLEYNLIERESVSSRE